MAKITKFSPQVFPLYIWFSIQPTIDELKKRFWFIEDDYTTRSEITEDIIKPFWGAYRLTVMDKKTRDTGSLIVVNSPQSTKYSTIVHECCHAYDDFVSLLGVGACGETRAYLTEWMFDKIIEEWEKYKKNVL